MTTPRTGDASIDCTVVIATRDRCERLVETLARTRALPERPAIVVVDNGSTDATVATVRRKFPDVAVIALERNLGGAARNIGARAARSAYVAFCDDDCWWTPGALVRAVRTLASHPTVALVNGCVCVGEGGRIDAACDAMSRSPLPRTSGASGTAIVSFMAGAIVARRDAFLRSGGYHRRFLIGGEEALLALDLREAGYELVYEPDAVVVHVPATTARDPDERRRLVMRNLLWTAWLRFPFRPACAATLAAVRAACRDRHARRAFVAALRGAPWIARERRPVSDGIARSFRTLVSGTR